MGAAACPRRITELQNCRTASFMSCGDSKLLRASCLRNAYQLYMRITPSKTYVATGTHQGAGSTDLARQAPVHSASPP